MVFGRKPPVVYEPELTFWEQPLHPTLPNLSNFEFALFVAFMSFLVCIRSYGLSTKMKEEAVLNMAALNRVNGKRSFGISPHLSAPWSAHAYVNAAVGR